jgi:hypothetical protein
MRADFLEPTTGSRTAFLLVGCTKVAAAAGEVALPVAAGLLALAAGLLALAAGVPVVALAAGVAALAGLAGHGGTATTRTATMLSFLFSPAEAGVSVGDKGTPAYDDDGADTRGQALSHVYLMHCLHEGLAGLRVCIRGQSPLISQ